MWEVGLWCNLDTVVAHGTTLPPCLIADRMVAVVLSTFGKAAGAKRRERYLATEIIISRIVQYDHMIKYPHGTQNHENTLLIF